MGVAFGGNIVPATPRLQGKNIALFFCGHYLFHTYLRYCLHNSLRILLVRAPFITHFCHFLFFYHIYSIRFHLKSFRLLFLPHYIHSFSPLTRPCPFHLPFLFLSFLSDHKPMWDQSSFWFTISIFRCFWGVSGGAQTHRMDIYNIHPMGLGLTSGGEWWGVINS